MKEPVIVIDAVNEDGEYVLLETTFFLSEEQVAMEFLDIGFGAAVEEEIETPYGKYWRAKIRRS